MKIPNYINAKSNEPIYDDSHKNDVWSDVKAPFQLIGIIIGVPVCVALICASVYLFAYGIFH
jgi:hypothetical protein